MNVRAGRAHCGPRMLQALSNQKLAEMRLRFGVDRVGLQTGDGSLNIGGAVHIHARGVAWPYDLFRHMLARTCSTDFTSLILWRAQTRRLS